MDYLDYSSSPAVNGLTGINPEYTVSAANEPETSEVDKVMIDHFINKLAEVALNIASREVNR